jgi:hypothetical protein
MANNSSQGKPNEDFDQFFQEHIEPVLERLEVRRHAIARNAILIGIVVGAAVFFVSNYFLVTFPVFFSVVLGVTAGGLYVRDQHAIHAIQIGIVVGAAVFFVGSYFLVTFPVFFSVVLGVIAGGLYVRDQRGFYRDFKESIITPVFDHVSDSVTYSPDEGVDRESVLSAEVFKEPRSFDSEDHIEATRGAVDVRMSEIQLQWGSGENKDRQRGLFMIASSHHEPEAPVRIYPIKKSSNVREERIGEKVNLESGDFEHVFDVRGDQIEARRVLTPDIMQQLLALNDHVDNETPYMTYKGDTVYICVPLKKNILEPRIFGRLRKNDIEEYVKDITSFLGIIRILDLKERS